jgi:short-subunit dehydrogenase
LAPPPFDDDSSVPRAAPSELQAARAVALRDRVALVTGASTGMGRAIALMLAERGARVWLVSRNAAMLDSVARFAAEYGTTRPRVRAMDLTAPDSAATLAEEIESKEEGLDVLVHAAGTIALGPLETASVEDLDSQFALNARAPYVLTKAVLHMLIARAGQVVFIGSSVYGHARADVSQYAATQYALKAIADSLREEVNHRGVRVLTVLPGRTASPLGAMVHELEGRVYRPERLVQPEDVATMVVQALELSRRAEVTEIHIRPALKPL